MNNNQSNAGQQTQTPDRSGKQPRAYRRSSENPRERRFRRGSGKKQRRSPPVQQRFEGATEALKGHYYDMGYNRSEQFNKTTKAICNYVGTTYRNGADVRVSIESLTTLIIPINDIGAAPTPLERRIWGK